VFKFKSFTKTSPEKSGGTENSAEISGTNGINFFCCMYESSLPHPVWVLEINVMACNSVWNTRNYSLLRCMNRPVVFSLGGTVMPKPGTCLTPLSPPFPSLLDLGNFCHPVPKLRKRGGGQRRPERWGEGEN
jgi:hypothetical protein